MILGTEPEAFNESCNAASAPTIRTQWHSESYLIDMTCNSTGFVSGIIEVKQFGSRFVILPCIEFVSVGSVIAKHTAGSPVC